MITVESCVKNLNDTAPVTFSSQGDLYREKKNTESTYNAEGDDTILVSIFQYQQRFPHQILNT